MPLSLVSVITALAVVTVVGFGYFAFKRRQLQLHRQQRDRALHDAAVYVNLLRHELRSLEANAPLTLPARDVVSNANPDERAALRAILELDQTATPDEIEANISQRGGHSAANLLRGGKGVPYDEVVRDVAEHTKTTASPQASTWELERSIVENMWSGIWKALSPAQRQELTAKAAEHGASRAFAAPSAAAGAMLAGNAAGFSVYLAATTIVGATTGALGITLPFVFYTSMTKMLSLLLDPTGVGGVLVGSWFVFRLGSPNFKKTVPAVVQLCAIRQRLEDDRRRRIEQKKQLLAQAERDLHAIEASAP